MAHFSYISYNSYLAYEVVFLHHLRNSTGPKGTPLEYFRLCETFSKKNYRRVPLQFFDIFRRNGCWKIPKGPFSFFGTETFFIFFHKRFLSSSILRHFEVLLLFLSLRYGVDLGRSRIVRTIRCLDGKFSNEHVYLFFTTFFIFLAKLRLKELISMPRESTIYSAFNCLNKSSRHPNWLEENHS